MKTESKANREEKPRTLSNRRRLERVLKAMLANELQAFKRQSLAGRSARLAS